MFCYAGEQMKKVYVAGLYSHTDNGILGILDNIRKGQRAGTILLLKGYIPFVPWFDYHFQFNLRENETLTKDEYYNYSIEWLKCCDYMVVISNHKNSYGVNKEIEIAKKNNIKIYYSIDEFMKDVKP